MNRVLRIDGGIPSKHCVTVELNHGPAAPSRPLPQHEAQRLPVDSDPEQGLVG